MDLFSIGKMLKKHKSYRNALLITKISFVMLFLCSTEVFAYSVDSQNAAAAVIVKGTVRDNTGPLPGISVKVKGTSKVAITDINGKFSISAEPTETLVFTSVGYESKEVLIKNNTSLSVLLAEVSQKIDEVVVVGYARQKKESVVGAISQVKGADLVKAGVPSISNALTGRVPGMVTIQQSGMPGGEDAKIYIRGLSSFNGDNQPLVLVDGIERSMSDIDPSEVESISVLKDASATSVYGVKGGNGVILITTKRGQEGRMSISASYEHTLKAVTAKNIQENSYNTLMARNEMYRNQNTYSNVYSETVMNHYRDQDLPYLYPDNNTFDLMVADYTTDYKASVSASGGTKTAKYFISMGILHEGDMLKNEQTLYDPSYKYDRVNFRMNFDFNLSKSTLLSISSSGYVGSQSFGGRGDQGDQGGVINSVFTTPPYRSPAFYPASILEPKYLADGVTLAPNSYPDPFTSVMEDRYNANVYWTHNAKGTVNNIRDRLATDLVLSQNLDAITKGLSFKAAFSYNSNSSWEGGGYTYSGKTYELLPVGETGYQWAYDYYGSVTPPYQSAITRSGNPSYNYVYSGQFNYGRSFGKHNVTGLALAERRISQNGASFPHYEEKWSGRATYDYGGKYLFEATVGVSGSEQFAAANRFGYFPALAAGWNIAKEKFMKDLVPSMNNFKVRYSYGESGSDQTGSSWIYLKDYTNNGGKTLTTGIAGSLASNIKTYKEGAVPNINAQWSRAQKHNLGIDLGFFNLVTFSAELYSENYTNILMNRNAIPSWFGQSLQRQNIGSTKRHGYELEAGYSTTVSGLHYWVKANYNYNENRIVSNDEPVNKPAYQKAEGMPIGVSTQNLNIGYYTNMDEMTNYSLKNSNLKTIGTDMLLDFSANADVDNDRVPFGNTNRPNVTFSLSGGLDYKNFDFSFLLQGASMVDRNYGAASNPLWTNNPGATFIKFRGRDDLWTPNNLDAAYATWGAWNSGNKGTINASYVRLKSIEVGYTLEGSLLKAIGLSSARVSLNASNLFTYAPGFNVIGDPENEVNYENGNDYAFQAYPIPKRVTAALKINF